jgi:ribosomal protein S18 acetylase RimI-like enzyme
MEVSRARSEDAVAVAALWTSAYSDDPRGGRRASYAAQDFQSAAKAGEVLVARDEGALAGVVAIYLAGARGGMIATVGEAELSRLAVAERFRRRGIGRILVESCVQIAIEHSATALVLWSRPHQVEAHRLYSSLGFRRVPDCETEDPDGRRLVFSHAL